MSSILCDFGASKILCGNCCLFLVGSYVEGGKVYGSAITMASAYVYSMQLLFVELEMLHLVKITMLAYFSPALVYHTTSIVLHLGANCPSLTQKQKILCICGSLTP